MPLNEEVVGVKQSVFIEAIVGTHLHRLTLRGQSGEADNVREVDCDAVKLDRLYRLTTHQLLRHRPDSTNE